MSYSFLTLFDTIAVIAIDLKFWQDTAWTSYWAKVMRQVATIVLLHREAITEELERIAALILNDVVFVPVDDLVSLVYSRRGVSIPWL